MPEISAKLDVRDAILDATDVLLARYGYRKMTVEDIAVEAGIGKGTVYLHFSSKEEVVLSHIDRIVDRLKQRMWAISRSNASELSLVKRRAVARIRVVRNAFTNISTYSFRQDEPLTLSPKPTGKAQA